MKITLEINTSTMQDVVDAINTLQPLLPKEIESNINKNNIEQTNINLQENHTNIVENRVDEKEYESLKEELDEFKKLVERLNEEKESIVEENESLIKEKEFLLEEKTEAFDKISSLEKELEESKQNVLESNKEYNENDIENIKKEYEIKIEELNKNVTFHENRSNKNFEEVKRLRTLIDSLNAEKKSLDKKITSLDKEVENLKNSQIEYDVNELENLNSENKNLLEKISSLEQTKENLEKEVLFHKGRSKENWDKLKELKSSYESAIKDNEILKSKVKELVNDKTNNSNSEKNKLDFIQAKNEYENTISELRLHNDKLQNELNLYSSKYSESTLEELEYLKAIKRYICRTEGGATFWSGVEANLGQE